MKFNILYIIGHPTEKHAYRLENFIHQGWGDCLYLIPFHSANKQKGAGRGV